MTSWSRRLGVLAISALSLLLIASAVEAQIGLDFALDSFAVDGNILGQGNADGIVDFLDNFSDGSLTLPPTSRFSFRSPVQEVGGFLRFTTADGAFRTRLADGREFLVDRATLDGDPGVVLRDGQGHAVITASFRADVPGPGKGTNYGLFLITVSSLPPDQTEVVSVQLGVAGSGQPFIIGGLSGGQAGTPVFVDLSGVTRVIFRLSLNDTTNQVLASFSLDGGTTFQGVPLPAIATVFSTGSSAVAEAFGSVLVATPPSTARGSSGNSGFYADPVNTATGSYIFSRTDLALPGRGVPFAFTRTYNSDDAAVGVLGPGWTHSYAVSLQEASDGIVTVRWDDGREEFYHPIGSGAYERLFGGVFSALTKLSDGAFTLTRRDQTEYAFDAAGVLRSITDRNGNSVRLGYSGNLLTTISDSVGRIAQLVYDNDRLLMLFDPVGRVVRYAYDGHGRLIRVTDPGGGVMAFAYGANGLLTEIRDERGEILVANTYDADGRVVAQANGRGATTTFAYGAVGDTSIVDPRGHTTVHTHDAAFRLVEVTDAAGGRIAYEYDGADNRIARTDENGHGTRFEYDARGNLTQIIDPLGNTFAFVYNVQNRPTRITNPRGFTTMLSYDGNGNLTTLTDALGHATRFAYDTFGQVIRKTDARGNVTRYIYDGHGNLIAIEDALGGVTRLAYDGAGRLVELTDPNGGTARAHYDPNSRMASIVDALGNTTRFAYDPAGHLIETIDARGHATGYRYDAAGNLVHVADALGHVTRYAYDLVNNRTAVTNAKGHRTEYVFDELSRLVRVTDPLAHQTRYTYDPAGNLLSRRDANGVTNEFTYDATNRLRRVLYGDGASVLYTLDANGNRATMTDARGLTRYTHDALDRLIEVAHAGGDTVRYAYDAAGNRSQLTYPDGVPVTFSYDALNRLAQVIDRQGRTTSHDYDAASNLRRLRYPNGAHTSYSYDAANRVLTIEHLRGNQTLAAVGYLLDGVGNRTRVTRDGKATSYAYDALSQLISVTEPSRARTEYVYDAVGNRVGEVVRNRATSFTYDAADRLLQAGKRTFEYDANGNRIRMRDGVVTTYAFDAADRLRRVEKGGEVATYEYDGDGNKVVSTLNGDRYEFVLDVATPLPVALAERGPSWNIDYVYGLERISQTSSDFERFYHHDGLGSVIRLSDENGGAGPKYSYDAWGGPEGGAHASVLDNRFRFTSEEVDELTGLYYLRARWYDPVVGRFLAKDLIQGAIDVPLRRNPFIYALNNPLRFSDPSGLSAQELQIKSGAGVPDSEIREWTIANRTRIYFGVNLDVQAWQLIRDLWSGDVQFHKSLLLFEESDDLRDVQLRELSYRCYPGYELFGFEFSDQLDTQCR